MLGTIVLVVLVFLVALAVVPRLLFPVVLWFINVRLRRDVELWQKRCDK